MEGYKQPPKKDNVRIVNSVWSRPATRYSLTLVAGVFIGFMVFSLLKFDLTGTPGQTDEMKGTMYNSGSPDNMKTADILQYDSPVANAVFKVRYNGKIVEIAAELNSPDFVKCSIQFDYTSFTVLSVQNVSVNGETTALAAGNFIQINNTGANRFLVYLQNKTTLPENLDFKIFQNDSPVFQNTVQVNKD